MFKMKGFFKVWLGVLKLRTFLYGGNLLLKNLSVLLINEVEELFYCNYYLK